MTSGTSTITVQKNSAIADIPPRIFGSFVEHLGRCVYGGIYEPSHPTADENGFRQDVINLVKELGVTCVRYPGGNFVSGFNWEDSVGPREQRPIRRDLAWHSTETNEVGIDDFYRWSKKTGTEIMLAVNMGTRGLKAALEELEYVNGAPGTELADRRVRNGITEPMDIKMWCIGNEMDGPWQVGHMSPDEYAAAVDRVAHAMKLAESGLELVACGSSSAHANVWILGTQRAYQSVRQSRFRLLPCLLLRTWGKIVARLSGKFTRHANVHLHRGGMCRRSQKCPHRRS